MTTAWAASDDNRFELLRMTTIVLVKVVEAPGYSCSEGVPWVDWLLPLEGTRV